MEWYIYALTAGVAWGILSGATKTLLEKDSVIEFTFLIHFLALLLYTPLFFYLLKGQNLIMEGVILAGLSGVVNIVGIYLYNDSIKIGKISEEIPLTRTTPIFTAILGFLILGESMNLPKATGILMITAGSILVMKDKNTSIAKSFSKIFTKKPALLAVLSALVYSFASIIDRTGTQMMPPELYTFFIYLMIASGFLAVNLFEGNKPRKLYTKFRSNSFIYLSSSILALTGSLAIFKAFSMAEASLVIPLLQIQVFIAILIGREYFQEENLLMKIIGSTILIFGLILLTI